jgi:hypothetical protein
VAGGMRLRALRRGLPTEDIGCAYGTAMCESSRARSAENPRSRCRRPAAVAACALAVAEGYLT